MYYNTSDLLSVANYLFGYFSTLNLPVDFLKYLEGDIPNIILYSKNLKTL